MFKYSIPKKKLKGLLIFKHLEQKLIINLQKLGYLDELKKHYNLSLYFGGSVKFLSLNKEIDFVIAGENVIVNETDIDIPILRFSGNSFISDNILNYIDNKKKYDYIGVFNRSKNKRPNDFIEITKILHNYNPKLKIKLITYGSKSNNLDFLNHKYLHPNFEHIDYITSINMFPLNEDEIFKEIAQSKCFIFTSKKEGAARVVAESCLLKIPVIYNYDLEGGSINNLMIKSNLVYSYKDINEVPHIKFKRINEHYYNLIKLNHLERDSTKLFAENISEISPNTNSKIIKNDHISMSKLLPSHGNIIDSNYSNLIDDEIYSIRKFIKYFRIIENIDIGKYTISAFICDLKQHLKRKVLIIKKKIWEILN